MNLPTIAAPAAAILSDDTGVTIGLVGVIVTLTLALGESRWQVSALREWKREHEALDAANNSRLSALEVREGRTMERLDYLTARLDRIDGKLDQILAAHTRNG